MRIFANKDLKILFTAVITVLLGVILFGQLAVRLITHDYKQQLIAHDYELAGYLAQNENGTHDAHQIASVFTAAKTQEHAAAGQKLLQTAAYNSATPTTLIPEVADFQRKYTLLALASSIGLSLLLLAVLMVFARRQDNKLRQAAASLASFMDGNVRLRLRDHEEGSLSRLFTAVNGLATSLTAHITKEKNNKEFLQDIISDISHQLKTPLTALQMYNEIIGDEHTGNGVVDNFTLKSKRELLRMEHLIQNLLKLARLDAGTITLEQRELTLGPFLEAAVLGFRTRAELENKTISLTCPERLRLNCDADWLLEAVSNIIKNALDHTDTGGSLEIAGEESPLVTTIIIRDNGNGIHPEDLHSIFKRFYRSRFSQDKQGIGIGLTLSKAIVDKHGGSITVQSVPGKGTAFRLLFPKLTNL